MIIHWLAYLMAPSTRQETAAAVALTMLGNQESAVARLPLGSAADEASTRNIDVQARNIDVQQQQPDKARNIDVKQQQAGNIDVQQPLPDIAPKALVINQAFQKSKQTLARYQKAIVELQAADFEHKNTQQELKQAATCLMDNDFFEGMAGILEVRIVRDGHMASRPKLVEHKNFGWHSLSLYCCASNLQSRFR